MRVLKRRCERCTPTRTHCDACEWLDLERVATWVNDGTPRGRMEWEPGHGPRRFPWLCGFRTRGLWWFRLFGYGVRWKRITLHPLLFSERVLGKGVRVGGWHFAALKPR